MNIRYIIKNAIYLLFGSVFIKFLNAFIIIFVANYLSPSNYGVLNLSLSLSAIFTVLSELGLNNTLIRESTKENSSIREQFINYIRIRSILLILIIIIVILFIEVFYSSNQYKISIYVLILLNLIGSMFISSAITYFQIEEKMQYISLINVFSGIATALLLVIAMILKGNILLFSLAYGASNVIVGLISFIFVIKKLNLNNFIKDLFLVEFNKSLLVDLQSFSVARILGTFQRQMGPIILERVTSVTQVGYFSVGYKIPSVLYTIPQVVATSFYTVLFKNGNKGNEQIHSVLTTIQLRIMSLLGLILWIPFLFYSEEIIGLLFNQTWNNSVEILKSISIIILLQSISYPLADSLTTSGFQKKRTKVQLISVIIGASLLFVLGSKLGSIGAAYSIVIMESSMLGGYIYYHKKQLLILKSIFKNLISFTITVLIKLIVLNGLSFNFILELLILELILIGISLLFQKKELLKIFF